MEANNPISSGISYFAVIQIREFLEDFQDNHSHDLENFAPFEEVVNKTDRQILHL